MRGEGSQGSTIAIAAINRGDEIGWVLHSKLFQENSSESGRRATAIGCPRDLSKGAQNERITAALVAEQIAPSSGARSAAIRRSPKCDRAGAGNECDAAAIGGAGGEHERYVGDHLDGFRDAIILSPAP